ncbi:MAG TPA: ABC-F family ATP-binding cassette domain-containing protein [Flavobacteriaceae bacterium]|nr:ABC-F family ATP-binding cassette domain-containing protein [Flavobacteriaceae bacterium]
MNYISVENISKSYGERVLYTDVSFGINAGQKIGFIAPNGSGKTSLLRILSGIESPDSGEVNTRNNITISFLQQDPQFNPNISIEEAILSSPNPILKTISNYERAIKNPEDTDAMQDAFDAMEAAQAWDFETQYKQILSQLKLDDIDQRINTLSGGQKRRLALAIAILTEPDVLLLDEPTNHLDLEMIEWLEAYFARENITLFMITHDRYFLERVCNEILELDEGEFYSYKGNYSYYLEKREHRLVAEESESAKAKQLYKKELNWMRTQPKARGTKSKSRISNFDSVHEKAMKRRQEHEVELELNMERLGTKIVEMHNVSKRFGDKLLFEKFNYNIKPGERIGIIGNNGTGKSTFLQILIGATESDTGKVVIGETVKFGYYSQAGIKIKPGQKVIDVIREFGDYIPLKKGRQISAAQLLERFLFDRKKQYDYVEKLSGGEQKRLYLCTVLITNPNFLILDEPTNDLDIVTLQILESFLLDFPGCLLVVSHDRFFMDKIIDHLLVFKGNGKIEGFSGSYSDYREHEEEQVKIQRQTPSYEKPVQEKKKTEANTLTYKERKEYGNLESRINRLEIEKEKMEQAFATEDWDMETINEKSKELQAVIDEIEEKTERWFELGSKLEN